ncbi:MAG: hypothetical protein ACOC80_07145 [Petrotogales bacterium]
MNDSNLRTPRVSTVGVVRTHMSYEDWHKNNGFCDACMEKINKNDFGEKY